MNGCMVTITTIVNYFMLYFPPLNSKYRWDVRGITAFEVTSSMEMIARQR